MNVGVIRNTNFTKEGTLDDSDIAYLDVEARKLEKRRLEYGDIILEKSGGGPKQAVGRVVLFDKQVGDFSFSNFTAALRIIDRQELDFRFLHQYLHWTYISGVTEGMQSNSTGIRNLDGDAYKAISVPLPPLSEQQRIVGILDEAFDAIAIAKANTEKNLQNARALFESHLEAVFSEDERAFESVELRQLASDISDGDHMPPPKSLTGVPFITIGNIEKVTRRIDFSDTFTVAREYFERLKTNRRPRPGDVLYTVTGSFGIPVLVTEALDFCFQRHIALVRPKGETDSEWLQYLLMSPSVAKQAEAGATGTAQRTVSLGLLRGFRVPNVPRNRQSSAAAELRNLSAETQRLASIYQRKLAALEALKKSLLHQAFAGSCNAVDLADVTSVGIDVGGTRKGFHAVALSAGKYLDRIQTGDVRELSRWCRDIAQARVIAIDAPCRWSNDGRARLAERQLMAKRIWCFSTPIRQRALVHPSNHFGWMLQGEALFEALELTHPLCRQLPVTDGGACCLETFPHAITWHLRGGSADASRKRVQRRALLAEAGIDTTELTNIDLIDAALCALTANIAATGGKCLSFGEPETGLIIVPAGPLQ